MERPTRALIARGKEVLVIGAGDAGQLVIRELQRNPQLGSTPIGLIDDDRRKKNLRVHGVRVLGTTFDLPHILRDNKPDEVLIAIPSAAGEVRQRIVNMTREGNVPVKTLPGLYELISGESELATQIRPVQVEDVLGREPVEVDLEASASYVGPDRPRHRRGRLDRLRALPPDRAARRRSGWCCVDQGETALFEIERELVDERGFAASVPVLADCKSRTKMRQVFERYQPAVVFHAAAYKHVPLMEANPLESVRNNALGDARRWPRPPPSSARSASSSSRRTRPSTRRPSWASRRRSASGSSRPTARARTSRPASSRSASATCSARRAA